MSASWKTVYREGKGEKREGAWVDTLDDKLERYPVDGGWLYRNTIQTGNAPPILTMAFVPTPAQDPTNG